MATNTSSTATKDIDSTKLAPPKPAHATAAEASRLCNAWVESGITKNASIQFLLKTLLDAGCTPPDHFIRCVVCEQPQAGGFGMVVEESLGGGKAVTAKEQCKRTARDLHEQIRREQAGTSRLKIQPEIFVCQQYMESEHMTHKTVHHELIHAIDMCRTKMDPLNNCVQMACTEIRAENLSGECSFWRELPRMSSFRGHGQACVRRRAILSVRANPNCTARAEEYVDAALPRCFQDVYPYDRHPNQR